MSLNKTISFFLLSVCSTAFLCCTQPARKIGNTSTYIRVNDFRGKEIILQKQATRIICLIESALSGIYMLKAENQLIGVPSAVYDESVALQYSNLDERIKNKTIKIPGNWDFVSIESIVALSPDLVIIWASQSESIESIEKHGIPVYGVFLKSFSDVYKEIKDLGILTGKSQRADSLINYTRNEIDALCSEISVPEKEKKEVYFVWSQGLLETAGTASTVNELIELAGAKNSCILNNEHVVINKEKLLEWNPDVILMWYNNLTEPADIINLSELQYINAVKHKQVYELPSVFMCDLWTLKFPYAVKMMAKWCYPANFSGMDLDEEKQKMLIELYGLNGKKLF
jgi:iron complex transport system substrate-binding protein